MELILLSGVSTLGLLIVHLFDYLLEPSLRIHTRLDAQAHVQSPPNTVPARSPYTAAELDRAA
jgi:hypothetical protein